MKNFLYKHYFVSFYIITLIFSFLLLIVHLVFTSIGEYISLTQFSPFFAVFLFALLFKNRTILTDIKVQISLKETNWLLPAITLPFAATAASSAILSLLDIPFSSWTGDTRFYILNIISMFIGCFAEEIGWRGFLLPRLQKKYSPFTSGLIIGVLWGVWHLSFIGGILGFLLYTLTIVEASLIMTWLYNKSSGNLFYMVVYHFVFNLSSHLFLWERFGVLLFSIEAIVFGLLCIFVIMPDRKEFFKNPIKTLNV